MAPYAEHVVVCTGKEDWTSRIEDEESPSGDFVRGLKGEIGRGGKSFDPFTNILTTLSSLPPSPTPSTTSILLFPTFLKIPSIPHNPQSYSLLSTAYLKAHTLHPSHAPLSSAQKAALTRNPSLASDLPSPIPITTPQSSSAATAPATPAAASWVPFYNPASSKSSARRG
ncbi:hypothetical protein GRF29_1g549010 [Pseudopithomyces chartarum]|uniref:Uncharacterized protein n=1 Tax=Pseudopithomyces chartarum TaxID=1892770 RepID=A0AAN6RKK3_9PLEO|nr:hypothetical protein GRF29_1g549010 [Pseudopithomyces chartarum]